MIDSLGIEGEIPYNPYLMCNNNPLGLFDITGEIVPVAVAGWAAADAVAAAIETAIVTLTAWVGTAIVADLAKKTECRKPRCAPCDPPAGTLMYRLDAPEPGKEKEFRGHYPFLNQAHYHYYIVHQIPAPSCECKANRTDKVGVKGVTGADNLLPGAILYRNPTGGGLML